MDAQTPAFQMLPIAQVRESKLNPRRRFNEQQLAELAESIKRHGILTPLLARPVNGHYELAAGHRRRRAAEIAGLTEVPVRLLDLDDQAFLEVLTIENLQREDVHPLEEAEGYQRLLKLKGYTVELVAEKIGRDASYVYRRLHLLKLIDAAKEAFLDGRIQIGHALKLAPLEPGVQADAFKQLFREETDWDEVKRKQVKVADVTLSPSELDAWIKTEVYLDLSRAGFAKDDADLLPKAGACTACTKRTGANLALFDDTKKGDNCLDRACFHQKQNAHLVQIQKDAKKQGRTLVPLTRDWGKKDTVYAPQANFLKPSEFCDAKEEGVHIDGPLIGKTQFFCRDSNCPKHGRHRHSGGGREQKTFAEIWRGKRAKLDERIEVESRMETWRQIVHAVPGEFRSDDMAWLGIAMIQDLEHDSQRLLCACMAIEGEKGDHGTDFETPLVEHFKLLDPSKMPGFLLGLKLFQYGRFEVSGMDELAGVYEIDAAAIAKNVADPLIAEFDAKKAKAEAAHKKKQAAEKKTAKAAAPAKGKKKAAPKSDAKRLAANDVDDDADFDDAEE